MVFPIFSSFKKTWWNYFIHGTGQYTSNGVDGMAFKASKYSDFPDWPDIQLHFLSYSAASDHGVRFCVLLSNLYMASKFQHQVYFKLKICVRHLMGLDDKVWRELFEPLSYVDTASIFATLVRPKSRGWVRLRSANPTDLPIIDPQYYSHTQDALVMLDGIFIILILMRVLGISLGCAAQLYYRMVKQLKKEKKKVFAHPRGPYGKMAFADGRYTAYFDCRVARIFESSFCL